MSFSKLINLDLNNLTLENTENYTPALSSLPAGADGIGINYIVLSPASVPGSLEPPVGSFHEVVGVSSGVSFALPLSVSGSPIQGVYTIIKKSYYINTGTGLVVEPLSEESQEINFAFQTPVPSVQSEVDYFLPGLTVVDVTNYMSSGVAPSSFTREMRIVHPDISIPDAVSVGPTVFTSQLIGQLSGIDYVYNLTNNLTYQMPLAYGSDFSIVVEVGIKGTVRVYRPEWVCKMYCVLKKLKDNMLSIHSGEAALNAARHQFLTGVAYAVMIQLAYRCQKMADVVQLTELMLALTGSSDGCGCCDDDEPALITGLGGSISNSLVLGTPGQVNVVYDINGNAVVSLHENILNILSGLAVQVQSEDGSIQVNAQVIQGVLTFDLSVSPDSLGDRLDVEFRLSSPPNSLPLFSILKQTVTGSYFSEVAQGPGEEFVTIHPSIDSLNAYQNSPVVLRIANFLSEGSFSGFASAERVGASPAFGGIYFPNIQVFPEVVNISSSEILVRLKSEDGMVITGGWLASNMLNSTANFKITLTK